MSQKLKKRLDEILDKAQEGDIASRIFDISIMSLIVLNVIAVMLETIPSLSVGTKQFLRGFEILSVAVFTIEYLLRMWSCTVDEGFEHPVKGRLKFAVTPLALVDLAAILPFYLPMIFPIDLRLIRAIRLFRLFRLFKLGRYSKALHTLGHVIREKKEELLITVFAVFMLLIFASSLMYFVENKAQPEVFSSIPESMWWGVATLTTVGYGDVYPVTSLGKFLGALIALLGVGLFALPAGILASGFAEEIKSRECIKITCPHCGREIDQAFD